MRVLLVIAAAITAGCAFTPQPPIVVKPELVSTQSSLGAGRAIYVDVVDERPSQALGTRGVRGVGAELKVEIRDLQYNVMMGFWAGTLRTQCSLKAICGIGKSRPFERLFRGEHEESVQVVQGAEANSRYVNDAISKAVNQLLDDQELGQCLGSTVN